MFRIFYTKPMFFTTLRTDFSSCIVHFFIRLRNKRVVNKMSVKNITENNSRFLLYIHVCIICNFAKIILKINRNKFNAKSINSSYLSASVGKRKYKYFLESKYWKIYCMHILGKITKISHIIILNIWRSSIQFDRVLLGLVLNLGSLRFSQV